MKLIFKSTCAVLALVLTMLPVSYAATDSKAFTVAANVESSLSFQAILKKITPPSTAEVDAPNLNFGPLVANPFGGMDAASFFKIYLAANTQSLPYTITQNGTTVTNGTTPLPNNACKVTPAYDSANNGGQSNPGTLGTAGTWVGTRTIYTSDAAGSARTIQAFYGLIGDPATGAGNYVPNSQPAGNYSGNVTFTLTTT